MVFAGPVQCLADGGTAELLKAQEAFLALAGGYHAVDVDQGDGGFGGGLPAADDLAEQLEEREGAGQVYLRALLAAIPDGQ